MRYILLDRITSIVRHEKLEAYKNVSLSEDIFTDHFFGYPVMPGALLIESLAQAGTALIEISENFTKKALLVMADRVKFRAMVRPGDRLSISIRLVSLDPQAARMDGVIVVGEREYTSAILTFSIQDDALFYPHKTKYLIQNLYDIWLEGAEKIGFELLRLP